MDTNHHSERAPGLPGNPVDRTISPDDGMCNGDEEHYFSAGRSALLNIKRALSCAPSDAAPPQRILDLPCGHGRVLRHLRAEFPRAEITACDLMRDGVDFCAETFGATAVYSEENPAQIPLARGAFDLIWVGSLFTHFNAGRWPIFLEFFRDLLRPGGLLVFSTHGRYSRKLLSRRPSPYGLDGALSKPILREYGRTGFGYVDYPTDSDFGVSIADPGWVCRSITNISHLRLVGLTEQSWDDHHDVYACVRDAACEAHRVGRRSPRLAFSTRA